jgi:hypothetical protein
MSRSVGRAIMEAANCITTSAVQGHNSTSAGHRSHVASEPVDLPVHKGLVALLAGIGSSWVGSALLLEPPPEK